MNDQLIPPPSKQSIILQPKSPQLPTSQQQNQYQTNFQYLCAVIGFAVGYGSFWRFPYLIYQYGSDFVLVYFLILLLFGLPLLYLQTVLGQMHQESIPFIMSHINKGMKWLGMTFVIVCFNFSGYYNIILAYSYRFVVSIFDDEIHFEDQSIKENKIFAESILHSSGSINQFEEINYPLFFFYILSIAICYYIISKSLKQSGKIVVFTALFPYILFIIMLLRGITLPGALNGLKLLAQFKGNIFSPTIWIQAITQVFYQLTLACSGIVHMSSMKKKTQPFLNGLYWILLSVLVCGLLCAANIFIYLGHFSQMIGVRIGEITLSGPQICFNIFPKALAILPLPRVWLLLFFITMVLLGIDTMIGGMETIVCYLKDQAKTNLKILGCKITLSHMKILLAFSYIIFIFPLTSNAGIYYLVWFDKFTVYIPLATNILLEIYLFVYHFPLQQLQKQTIKFTNTKIPSYIKYFLKSKILIVILVLNLTLTIYNQLFVYWREYSIGFYIAGWCWTLYPYVIAYLYWQKNKEDEWRLTFQQVSLTRSKNELEEKIFNMMNHDQEMKEIRQHSIVNKISIQQPILNKTESSIIQI